MRAAASGATDVDGAGHAAGGMGLVVGVGVQGTGQFSGHLFGL